MNRRRSAVTLFACIAIAIIGTWVWRGFDATRSPWDGHYMRRSLPWPLELQPIRDRTVRRFYRCGGRKLPPVRRYAIEYSNADHISMARLMIETESNARSKREWSGECNRRAQCPVTPFIEVDSPHVRGRILSRDSAERRTSTLLACAEGQEIRRFTTDSMIIYIDSLWQPAPPGVR